MSLEPIKQRLDDVFSVVADDDDVDDQSSADFQGAMLTLTPTNLSTDIGLSNNSSSTSSIVESTGQSSPVLVEGRGLKSTAIPKLFTKQRSSSSSASVLTPEDPSKKFFATRTGAFDAAVDASKSIILMEIDGEFRGAWLLTEIGHWDTEKERLVMLSDHSLLIVKYDFIALAVLDYRRLALADFDRIIFGNFTYPQASVVPKVDKLVTMVSFMKGFVLSKLKPEHPQTVAVGPDAPTSNSVCVGTPSLRRSRGVRAMWNKGNPVQITHSWNPWSRNIPFVTYTSHPLAFRADNNRPIDNYDVENFMRALVLAIERENEQSVPISDDKKKTANIKGNKCRFEERPIVVENYLGLAAFFHNVNNLGFFKSRGRVSF